MDTPTRVEMLKDSQTSESDNSNLSPRRSSSPSSSESEFVFPKCTSDWDSYLVDKLGVRYQDEDIFTILTSKWCLFHLTENDHRLIERCLDACDLKLDYESLDVVASSIVTPLKKWATWNPDEEQLKIIRTEPLLEK